MNNANLEKIKMYLKNILEIINQEELDNYNKSLVNSEGD